MPMTAAGITKFSQRLPLIRSQKVHQIKRKLSTFSRWKDINTRETWSSSQDEDKEREKGEWWVPDERTGIYFPKGQERVIDDIPNGAASLPHTYWLRNEDGVDKPDHEQSFPN